MGAWAFPLSWSLKMPLRPVVFACAALALAAIALAPLAPPVRLAFSTVCHQAPERCFAWFGGPMPVCARCLGVYLGLAAAAVRPVRAPTAAIVALGAATGLDWLLNLAPNGPRCALALAFVWLAGARLLASREPAASN
jgi:hypothetical protein